MWRALTREVPESIARCELTHVPRRRIDVARARAQHRDYVALLEELGCRVEVLAADEAHPDSVFVEDPVCVFPEVALILRSAAETRRGEASALAEILAAYRPLQSLQGPATLDGGDVLVAGRTVFVGESSRSNAAGVTQVREALEPHGYRVQSVPVQGALHLKSAATALRDNCILLNPDWVPETAFEGFDRVRVDAAEPHGANVLRVGNTVVCAAAFPRTQRRLAQDAAQHGYPLRVLDASEFAKAEGALTCCSVLFEDTPSTSHGRGEA